MLVLIQRSGSCAIQPVFVQEDAADVAGPSQPQQSKAALRKQLTDNAAKAADKMIADAAKRWAKTEAAVSPLHQVRTSTMCLAMLMQALCLKAQLCTAGADPLPALHQGELHASNR